MPRRQWEPFRGGYIARMYGPHYWIREIVRSSALLPNYPTLFVRQILWADEDVDEAMAFIIGVHMEPLTGSILSGMCDEMRRYVGEISLALADLPASCPWRENLDYLRMRAGLVADLFERSMPYPTFEEAVLLVLQGMRHDLRSCVQQSRLGSRVVLAMLRSLVFALAKHIEGPGASERDLFNAEVARHVTNHIEMIQGIVDLGGLSEIDPRDRARHCRSMRRWLSRFRARLEREDCALSDERKRHLLDVARCYDDLLVHFRYTSQVPRQTQHVSGVLASLHRALSATFAKSDA